jgi:hypothetical protein
MRDWFFLFSIVDSGDCCWADCRGWAVVMARIGLN